MVQMLNRIDWGIVVMISLMASVFHCSQALCVSSLAVVRSGGVLVPL